MWVVKAGGKSLFQGTKGKKKITVSNSSFPSAGSVQTVASLFRGDDDSRKVSCVEVPNKLCHLEFVFGPSCPRRPLRTSPPRKRLRARTPAPL